MAKFVEWMEAHPKTVFIIRLILWTTFACVLPCAFIAWRYGIFTKASQLHLSGWGAIAIVIAVVFTIKVIKYFYKGMKPGFLKQCIHGFCSIILPLLILLIVVVAIRDSLDLFIQALGCVIICELIGIPLNPFPAWLEKRKQEDGKEHVESITDIVLDKIFKRKSGEQ